ncbi:hypothetical protein V2H45_16100 [Tumidithrix elongata RA019]|uniref:Uncharacterized protein n=1 Tax=Tumidithrix elongata BACA0141 TaxID=2716417 RepID=A0AAW9PZ21_9CYAN|nr:hypothetical protein [Tumidithrix elongata RA019]
MTKPIALGNLSGYTKNTIASKASSDRYLLSTDVEALLSGDSDLV